MNIREVKELVSITSEFFISLVVLLGGGWLLYTGKSPEMASSAITAVITFWFIRRQSEQQTKSTESLINAQSVQQSKSTESLIAAQKEKPPGEE